MNRLMRILALGLVATLVGCKGGDEEAARKALPVQIFGGGSSFVNPLMQEWASVYEKEKGVKVYYKSIGSTGGVQHMTEKTFQFGASDAFMTDVQLQTARETGGEVVHIPLAMGAVVVAYNLPDIQQPLRFTGPVLADIFLGNIKKWNEKPLQELNPSISLPDQNILVVRRQDGSGTTFVFTDYLSKVSKDWKEKAGVGTSIKSWPTGEAKSGNEGVAEYIAQTPGAIGYTELTYAMQKNLRHGFIKNRSGSFVRGELESVTAAAAAALPDIRDDLRYSLTDMAGADSYPISGTVWALLYVKQPQADKGAALVDFLRWATHDGQRYATEKHYAALPAGLVERISKKLDMVEVGK